MLKRLLSYLVPVNIYKRRSQISKTLEVSWNNGELVLDSQNTNYSFGSLQRILRKGLLSIGFDKIRKMDDVLILGVAAGSVIRTLIDEVRFSGKITGVELDSEILQIANEYFDLDKIPNLEICNEDAFEHVLKSRRRYDLVIIDIFQDTTMPSFLFEEHFIDRVVFLLRDGGWIIFNTMILTEEANIRNSKFLENLREKSVQANALPRVEQHNELILIHKPKNISSA